MTRTPGDPRHARQRDRHSTPAMRTQPNAAERADHRYSGRFTFALSWALTLAAGIQSAPAPAHPVIEVGVDAGIDPEMTSSPTPMAAGFRRREIPAGKDRVGTRATRSTTSPASQLAELIDDAAGAPAGIGRAQGGGFPRGLPERGHHRGARPRITHATAWTASTRVQRQSRTDPLAGQRAGCRRRPVELGHLRFCSLVGSVGGAWAAWREELRRLPAARRSRPARSRPLREQRAGEPGAAHPIPGATSPACWRSPGSITRLQRAAGVMALETAIAQSPRDARGLG